MGSRLDALIEQLHIQKATALLLEAGNSLFLVHGKETLPLANAKLTNEHVHELLTPAAPPDARLSLERREAVDFDYVSPTGLVHVEFTTHEGRSFARLTPSSSVSPLPSSSSPVPKPSAAARSQKSLSVAAVAAAESAPFPPPTEQVGLPDTFSIDDKSEVVVLPTADLPSVGDGVNPFGSTDARPAIEEWFEIFLRTRSSDLHLTPGMPAMVRSFDGEIQEQPEIPTVGPYELEQMLMQIMPPQSREEWLTMRDTDFAYDMPHARLRANVFYDLRGPCATFRKIPSEILTVADLALPPSVVDLCRLKKGLVLVTGPTGSGKTTTLAAMIDWINENRADHIITIEDPIEFVHTPKRCLIHQRQVGVHTRSFARALRAALREDPNIILVGEMRDLETIAIAIEMAETGHLVFGTLHTTTAATTVDRIVDQFQADKQEQVRQMLAESLKGVVSQTLCKRIDGGRVLALEVLLVTTAVSNMIREKKTFQIPSVLQTSRGSGMRLLGDSLFELVKNGVIEPQEAIDRAIDKNAIKRDLAAAHIIPPTGVV